MVQSLPRTVDLMPKKSVVHDLFEDEAVGRGRLPGIPAPARPEDAPDVAGPELPPTHRPVGADDAAHHLLGEGGGGDVEAEEAVTILGPAGVEHPPRHREAHALGHARLAAE